MYIDELTTGLFEPSSTALIAAKIVMDIRIGTIVTSGWSLLCWPAGIFAEANGRVEDRFALVFDMRLNGPEFNV